MGHVDSRLSYRVEVQWILFWVSLEGNVAHRLDDNPSHLLVMRNLKTTSWASVCEWYAFFALGPNFGKLEFSRVSWEAP